jgi:hypothetical protein
MWVDRQIETARRDIGAEVLSSGGLLEFRLGRLRPTALLGQRTGREWVTVDL